MSCSTWQKNVRPWLRGELSGDQAVEVEKHVSECYFCAVLVEKECAFFEALQNKYPVPAPSPGFRERVMLAATSQPIKASGGGLSVPVSGAAVAAALLVGIALGFGLRPDIEMASDPVAATYFEPPAEERAGASQTVGLAFNTAEAMEDVTLTVQLPSHVEVTGYPGYQQLSWKVSLDQGENLVKLPLNVLFPGEGELVAHLNDGEREKVFRTQLSQAAPANTSESAL